MHRYRRRWPWFKGDPSGPHALRAQIDHVAITGSAIGFVGDTAQLTATAYDRSGNAIPGVDVIWSSSQPTWISVVAGLCTFLSPGSATITATVDGRAYTTTATAAAPLNLSLDWAPLVRRADLAQPLTYTPYVDLVNGAGSGYQQYLLKQQGTNTLGVSRVMFPISATEVGGVAQIDALMANTYVPLQFREELQNGGPFNNTTAWREAGPGTVATGAPIGLNPIWKDPGTMDNQEIDTWKRGIAVWFKAVNLSDVGRKLRMGYVDSSVWNDSLAWAATVPLLLQSFVEVTLTADWAPTYMEFEDRAAFASVNPNNIQVVVGLETDDTGYYVAAGTSWNWHAHETDDSSNYARPLPFHETLGVLAQFQTQSAAVDSRNPTLLGGATQNATTIAAPDSDRNYGGTTYSELLLDTGDGIGSGTPLRGEHLTDIYPTGEPTGALWLHVGPVAAGAGAIPADGALVGYAIGSRTGTEYGPFDLVRDGPGPLPRYFRCRIPVNQFTTKYWKIAEGSQVGGNYRFITVGNHDLLVGDEITISGCSVSGLNGQWTIAAIPGGVTFEITTTAASSSGGAVATGDLDYTWRVESTVDGLRFNYVDAVMTAENPRSYGYHHALVPKRCVTGPAYNDAAFVIMPKSVPNLSVEEGIWVFRHVPIFGLTEILDLNGNASDFDQLNYLSPGLWQSGPLGSADASFACDVNRSSTPGCIDLLISTQRGSPFNTGDWVRWEANITAIPASLTTFARLVAFDIALAWKNHAVVAFGIGNGTGTSITWLNHGDTFLGGTVAITTGNGTTWDLDIVSGDSHMGIGGDRDVIRQTGGFTQAILAAGTGSVNASTVKGSIEAHIISRLGARQDYR